MIIGEMYVVCPMRKNANVPEDGACIIMWIMSVRREIQMVECDPIQNMWEQLQLTL